MNSPIRDMVDNILSNKEAEALQNFESALADKMNTALELRKQEIAATLGQEETQEFEDENV